MGRPKGSKNKLREFAETLVGAQTAAAEIQSEAKSVTLTLTEEDLAPIRAMKAKHDRAAEEYKSREIAAELARMNSGEIESLSVPQVVEFNMSAAFTKAAEKKAREAGYRFILHLRKSNGEWIFEATNEAPHRETPDQL